MRLTRQLPRRFWALCALLSAAAWLVSGCEAPKLAVREVRQTWPPDAQIRELDVQNRSGNLTVVTTDAHGYVLRATVRAWGPDLATADRRAQGIQVGWVQEGDRLVVAPQLPEDLALYSVDLELEVPQSLGDLRFSIYHGDVRVQASSIALRGEVVDGSLSAQIARWRGPSSLRVSNGELAARGRFSDWGTVNFDTRHGSIHLVLDWPSDAHFTASALGGEVNYRPGFFNDQRIRSHSRHELALTVGAALMDLSATAVDGNVFVEFNP